LDFFSLVDDEFETTDDLPDQLEMVKPPQEPSPTPQEMSPEPHCKMLFVGNIAVPFGGLWR
jgi:hypothetical protein